MTHTSEKFRELKVKNLRILQATNLLRLDGLKHGFSTRHGGRSQFPEGSLNLGYTALDSREAVEANREAFFSAVGMGGCSLVRLRQTHSDTIAAVDSLVPPAESVVADAAMTPLSRVILAVLTADCVPILVADPVNHVTAVIHAGWRGTAGAIAAKTIERLSRHYGCQPSNLTVSIGPSIRSCCYQVGEEICDAFRASIPGGEKYFSRLPGEGSWDVSGPKSLRPAGKFSLDLVAANRDQLKAAGVGNPQILVDDSCTVCCSEDFFSHRREGSRTGRMMAAVAMSP